MLNDEQAQWKIAARPEKKRLLIAVNCLAGVAIFFFGQSIPNLKVYEFSSYPVSITNFD
jgi:hypothetical protein